MNHAPLPSAPLHHPRRRRWLGWAAASVMPMMGACSSPRIGDYAAERPALDLRQYFQGTVEAHGLFTGRQGEVKRRFAVRMDCQWQGEEGVLDEAFTYSDGERQRRVWHLTHLGEGRYRGRADDVVGEALGDTAGNAFHWRYTLRLPLERSTLDVAMDDWMYLMDERVMLNRATMSKFGVRLGEVTLAFVKA